MSIMLGNDKYDLNAISSLWINIDRTFFKDFIKIDQLIQILPNLHKIFLCNKDCYYDSFIFQYNKLLMKLREFQYYYVLDLLHHPQLALINNTCNIPYDIRILIKIHANKLSELITGNNRYCLDFQKLLNSEEYQIVLNVEVSDKKDIDKIYDVIPWLPEYNIKIIKIYLSYLFRTHKNRQNDDCFSEVGHLFLFARKLYGKNIQIEFCDPLAFIFDVSLEDADTCFFYRTKANILELDSKGILRWCDLIVGPISSISKHQFDKSWKELTKKHSARKKNNVCAGCSFAEACNPQFSAHKIRNRYIDPLCPNTFNLHLIDKYKKKLNYILRDLSLKKSMDPEQLSYFLERFKSAENFTRNKPEFDNQIRWGHNWKLSYDLSMAGEMGWRHVRIMIEWLRSKVLPEKLVGCNILNIGPWTGGEAYLLAKLGAHVDVYEESALYRNTIGYISEQYNLDIDIKGKSLYELSIKRNENYDYTYFSGIISHLTDIVIGLRIIFNQLKNGGLLLLETQTSYNSNGNTEFWGPNRKGWIWFNISRAALLESLKSVGFRNIRIVRIFNNRRILIVAKKEKWVHLSHRMGLSVTNIP